MEGEYDEGCTCQHTPRQHFTMPGLPATAMAPCLVDGCPCLDYVERPIPVGNSQKPHEIRKWREWLR